jgi:hypothetical protein
MDSGAPFISNRGKQRADRGRHRGEPMPIKADQVLVSYYYVSFSHRTFFLLSRRTNTPSVPAIVDRSNSTTRVATSIQKEEPKNSERVSDSPLTVVAELLPENNNLANASTARKRTLQALFSAAQFLDSFQIRSVHGSA